MSRTRKPRKAYRPKEVVANPLNFFFGGLKRIDGEHLQTLNIKNHKALADMATGQGNRAAFDLIIGAINMANVMCERGIGDEYRAEMLAARDTMMAVRERYLQIGRFVLRGDELKTMTLAMEVHDAQLEADRIIDVERAADEVVRRVKLGINVERKTLTQDRGVER